jgi:hypothetical protein
MPGTVLFPTSKDTKRFFHEKEGSKSKENT